MHLILHFSLSKSKLLHNQSSMQVHLKQVSAYQCAQDNFTNKKPYKFQIPPSNYDSSHSSIIKFDRIQIKTKNAHNRMKYLYPSHKMKYLCPSHKNFYLCIHGYPSEQHITTFTITFKAQSHDSMN